MLPRPLAFLLAVVLLAAGAWRIGSLAMQQPVLGYANQFDMGRTSACLGLWPDISGPARYEALPQSPVGRYVEGDFRADECYISSELIFAGVAMAGWKAAAALHLADARSMDMRVVGMVKGGTLVLLALLFSWLLRRWPGWVLTHAAVFAIVLADPVVTLWLNTLYTEFSALLFLYAAMVALAVIVAETPETSGWYVAFGVSLFGLGMSRQQHFLLPVFLVLLILPTVWRHYRRALWSLAGVTLLVIGLQLAVIPRPASITSANNVNVVLGTLLPASSRQEQALETLGLPPSCESVIGATWYVTMGEDIAARCPAVMTIRRPQIVNLLLSEPAIIGAAFLRAAPLAQPPVLRYIGVEEKVPFAKIENRTGINSLSVGTWIERLPIEVFLGILLTALAAFPISLLAWARTTVRNGAPSLDSTLGAALTGIVAYAFVSSLLGDGIVEVPRHVHLGNVALQVTAVLAISLLFTRLASLAPRRAGSTPASVALAATPWYEWSLLGTGVAVAAWSPLWLALFQQQPLAAGVVDEPVRNRYASPVVRLHGWAMDPFESVRAFSLINGKTRIDARPWTHPSDPRGVALTRVFPTYRDPAMARFEIAIDTTPYGNAPISIRTYARTNSGVLTEIDRRTLVRTKP